MTMQHKIHPDDERLAALAGGDPDAAADSELSAHVAGCPRCTDVVVELTTLRSALAELPDLVPSRRLQLIPPVAEPRAAASGGWLRRLASPVMAAGFGLVLVGAVGTSGILNGAASRPTFESGGRNLAAATDDDARTLGAPDLSSEAKTPPASRDSATTAAGAETQGTTRPRTQSATESTKESISEPGGVPEAGGAADADGGLFSRTDARLPWLVILGLGVGLLLAGLYLRFSPQPRAG